MMLTEKDRILVRVGLLDNLPVISGIQIIVILALVIF